MARTLKYILSQHTFTTLRLMLKLVPARGLQAKDIWATWTWLLGQDGAKGIESSASSLF